MKFVKICILSIALPVLLQAAEQGRSWWCSFACGSAQVEEVEQQAAARAERERRKEYYKTHRADANILVHTQSQDLDRARDAEGKPLNSPSHIQYKAKMREIREIAIEVQAEAAGVAPEAWKTFRASTDARNRRPGQVYHQKNMVDLKGAAVPKALAIRSASLSVVHSEPSQHHTAGSLQVSAQEGENTHREPKIFTFDAATQKPEERTQLTARDSMIVRLTSDDKSPMMGDLAFLNRVADSEAPHHIPGQSMELLLPLPGQTVAEPTTAEPA